MATATKLIWLSDLHFTADGLVQGHDPRIRLRAAIDHINANHGDADLCVISGDLCERATPAGYAALSEELAQLDLPVAPMLGNHDDRVVMPNHIDVPAKTMRGFVQYALSLNGTRILCLDTLTPGADHGTFCDARMDWLHAELARSDDPTLVFMHHPPMTLGLPMQDQDCLIDGARLLDCLRAYECVTFMGCGHVHRPLTGVVSGLPYATMRSVLYQAPPPRPAWDWSSFKPAREAPEMGVLTISGRDVTLAHDRICPYEKGGAI